MLTFTASGMYILISVLPLFTQIKTWCYKIAKLPKVLDALGANGDIFHLDFAPALKEGSLTRFSYDRLAFPHMLTLDAAMLGRLLVLSYCY